MKRRVGATANLLIQLLYRVVPKTALIVISCYPDVEDQLVALLR
jgi:hypothetical protein